MFSDVDILHDGVDSLDVGVTSHTHVVDQQHVHHIDGGQPHHHIHLKYDSKSKLYSSDNNRSPF